MRSKSLRQWWAVVAIAVSLAACSSGSTPSSQSLQDAVCADARDLKASIDQLVDDVKNGNFGDAKEQVSKVKSDFEALQSSGKDLASSKRAAIRKDLDSVKRTLNGLTSASDLDGVRSTLDQAQSQLRDVVSSIADTLDC